jgi:outer membrane protein OmpA-like peptidoglycan-associated protein
VNVSLNGRMVTAEVPTGVDADKVKKVVSGVNGVSAVSAMLVYASYAEARSCSNLQDRLDKVTHGQQIPFSGSSTRPTAAGRTMLQQVAKLLQQCKTAVVYVGGHTDPHTRLGSTLTLTRARTMAKLLQSDGVEAKRLQARGYGDEFPLVKSSSRHTERNERGSIVVRSQ